MKQIDSLERPRTSIELMGWELKFGLNSCKCATNAKKRLAIKVYLWMDSFYLTLLSAYQAQYNVK